MPTYLFEKDTLRYLREMIKLCSAATLTLVWLLQIRRICIPLCGYSDGFGNRSRNLDSHDTDLSFAFLIQTF